MAPSPAHRFGQIIGEVLEAAVLPFLSTFAQTHGLYLDKKGRRTCRPGVKCSWLDHNGNSHDLDFVLERGGSDSQLGAPAAFIEVARRRYTKHSRNKAQEIQGAVEPLVATYRNLSPFKGAILAGVFTTGAVSQLQSLGFTVVYFPLESIIKAFRKVGIDASSDADTPDADFQTKVDAFERLSPRRKTSLAASLAKERDQDIQHFLNILARTVQRQIERIIVLALHGKRAELSTIEEAITFIENDNDDGTAAWPIERYEVQVRYNNGNLIEGNFKEKADAIDFLRSYQPIPPQAK